jgi:tetratricopeptide (TPR) repeat protein
VFKYNYALGLLRTGKQGDAISQLDALVGSAGGDKALLEDAALAQGWALEAHCSGGSRDALCRRSADEAYLRALDANPNSAKARLGLALFRLRRGGIKASEADFRAFLDMAPELDPPSRVLNFRKLGNNDFYSFAHAQIVDLSTPNQTMTKPSPLIMAADAIISCILGRTSDAGKILEGALTSAPGDVNVLKALGYLRWKDGQVNEVVDALKDLHDRGSYAVNLMLGKSYAKLRKRDLAERHFRALQEFPGRSDGHSLFGDLLADQPDKAAEAKAELQAALKIDPLDLLAWRDLRRLHATPPLSPEMLKNLPF